MNYDGIAIVNLLRKPQVVEGWPEKTWGELIEQGYHTGLLARIYFLLNEEALLAYIPSYLSWHFTSAYKLFTAHEQDIKKEIAHINGVFKISGIKPTYLKGTAYLLESLRCSMGRTFSDVDVFVPRDVLSQAENMLKWQGWTLKELDEHDQRYYRDWMHELPPMVNTKSGLTLDLHHNLIPVISKIKLDSNALFENCIDRGDSMTLSNEDKVLHSAAHLLLDGEFNHGFRDIHDIYLMISEFQSKDENFLEKLKERSITLNFEFILYHCLRLQQEIFLLKVKESTLSALFKSKYSRLKAEFIVKLFKEALSPLPNKRKAYPLCSWLLFVRSHWLKMPLTVLIPHLLYKGFISPFNKTLEEKAQ